MNRFLLVLLFGLCGGLAAHSAWYAWRTPANHELADAQYAWMKDSLKLTDAALRWALGHLATNAPP